ncbi:MAG: cytochrome c [Gammaproteobacteria bacterium]|nr:cytochrome c [Gammaproteobacteria bacterium]MDH5800021.1 cytochrome c [Gammaproteobacteria bacterium]
MKRIMCIVFWMLILFLGPLHARENTESPQALYKTYCWQCHGMQGNGMGVNIADMSVQPRDHTDAKQMSARSDEELFKVIKEGGQSVGKSVLMPPWEGVLTDEEIQELVVYLRMLCKCK